MSKESGAGSPDLKLEEKASSDHKDEINSLLAEKRLLWSNIVWNIALERAEKVVRNGLEKNNGLWSRASSRLNIDKKVVEFKFELFKLAIAVLENEDFGYRTTKSDIGISRIVSPKMLEKFLNEGEYHISDGTVYEFIKRYSDLVKKLNIIYDSHEDTKETYCLRIENWWRENGRPPTVDEFAEYTGLGYSTVRNRYMNRNRRISDEERKLWETGPQEEEK